MQIRFTGTSVGVETVMNKFYMFYTVHCGIIANENQQNAQIIYISQFVAPTCFGRAWPSSGCAVTV